ncbi:MAG TPA: hypothetical protein VGB14_06865 [Acidimicrobiales bacterium]|jgi:hypothetical protein
MLRRVYLRNVGPPAARFDPLDLDLSIPTGKAATKVLWSLTNTGGKTTLLRLLTSIVVPNARAQMGGANLGDFVQTGDTSHIVAEWESVAAGRFVVAGCYEWPGRQRPRDVATGSLNRAFYAFRVPERFDIADLPFLSDGRRRTLDDYRVALHELFRNKPAARFVWTRTQSEWATVLDEQTELDPELFRYQMRMNDDEAGAERLVAKLNSADAVIEFFVSALNDRSVSLDFTTTLRDYAIAAANRATLEQDAEFSETMAGHLERLAEAAEYATLAEGDVLIRASAAGELTAAIVARAAREETARDEAATRVAQHEERSTTANTEINRLDNIRSQLNLDEAQFRLEIAVTAEQDARARLDAAKREFAICKALEPVARLRNAEVARDAAQAAYDLAEADLKPLRDAVRARAAGLAAKYGELVRAELAHHEEAARIAQEAANRRAAAETIRTSQLEGRTTANVDLTQIDALVTEASAALDELRRNGDAKLSESAAEARARWESLVTESEGQQQSTESRVATLGTQITGLQPNRKHNERQLAQAEAELRRATEERERYRDEQVSLLRLDDLVALIGADEPGPATLRRATQMLDQQAQAAERTAADAATALRERQHEFDVLERDDLMASSADVERVRDHLVDAGVGATTGWTWIAANIADVDQRRDLISSHPEVANGVIVTDAARTDEARQVLEDTDLALRIAVLVTAAPTSSLAGDQVGFVVEPHRAVYDPDWAARTAEELRTEIDTLSETAAISRVNADRIRAASAEVTSFVRRWQDKHPALDANVITAKVTVEEYTTRLRAIVDKVAKLDTEREQLRDALPTLQRTIRQAEAAAARCGACDQIGIRAASATERRPEVAAARTKAQQAIDDADRTIAAAATERDDALARAAAANETAARWRDRLGSVGVEPGDTVPDAPVEQLEQEWRTHRAALEQRQRGSSHAALLDDAEGLVAHLAVEVTRYDAELMPEVDTRLASHRAATPEGRTTLLAAAEDAQQRCMADHVRANHGLEQARRTVTERQPEGRAVYVQLPEEWKATSADECVAMVVRVDLANVKWRNRQREENQAAAAAKAEAENAEKFRWSFHNTGSLWPGEPVSTGAVFEGSPDEATSLLQDRIAAHRATIEERDRAAKTRADQRDAVKRCAVDPRFAEFTLAKKAMSTSDEELYDRAKAWSVELGIRTKSIRDELQELNRHRESLVNQLHGLAEAQLRLLRAVSRSSNIPAGFGELSGKPAFSIDFDKLDETEALARLATRVDTWAVQLAADPKRATRTEQIDRWLAEAAKDLVKVNAGGASWRVKVLKPLLDNRVYYCAPDRIEKEYSGGQELTLAVLLYCCLAAVRSNHRTTGRRPAGALLLDNPFGKASNQQLIAMQQALARKSGIQLICATGLNDPTVISAFEGSDARVIRLRNDIDQRGGLHRLRISDPLVHKAVIEAILDGHDADDPNGYLSATSYTVNEPATPESP